MCTELELMCVVIIEAKICGLFRGGAFDVLKCFDG